MSRLPLVFASLLFVLPAVLPAAPALAEGADTGDIFGFSDGTDIGEKGDRSFEFDTLTRIGKRGGEYRAFSATAAAKATLTDDIAIGLGIGATRNLVKNVPGLDNSNTGGFEGVSGEVKYRVLERASNPFGLTLIAAPGYTRLDGEGLRTSEFGIGFRAAIDRELVKDKLYGAINFDYAPSWTWPRGGATMERGSSAGVSGAAPKRVTSMQPAGCSLATAKGMRSSSAPRSTQKSARTLLSRAHGGARLRVAPARSKARSI